MKKIIISFVLCLLSLSASAQVAPSNFRLGLCYNLASNSWLPIRTAQLGSAIAAPPAVAIIGSTGSAYYPIACDSSGNITVTGLSTATTMFTLDGSATGSTANGSPQFPYQTLDQLFAGVSAYVSGGGAGPIAIWSNPSSSYSTANAITIPAIPVTIYGNGSTWTFSAGVTNNALPFTRYDLTTVGTVTHGSCASTARSESHGGGYLGNLTLGAGCYDHMYGVNLSGNSYTTTVNGLLYGEALTGSQTIASGGTSAILALYNPNLIKSSGINVDMVAGGQLLMNGGLLTTAAGTANVNLPTANSASTAHSISGLITPTGNGIMCANGVTTYLYFGPSVTAATYCTLAPTYTGPFSIPSLKSTTGTRYLCIGTTGTITSSASACSGT